MNRSATPSVHETEVHVRAASSVETGRGPRVVTRPPRQQVRFWRRLAVLSTLYTGALEPQGISMRVSDSVGARVVEYRSLLIGSRVAGIRDNSVKIGGPDWHPTEQLDARNPLLALTSGAVGGLVVADGTRLHLVDSAGRLIRSVGRSGNGPGEFRQLFGLCRFHADSLLAIEYSDRRFSLWTSAGELVAQRRSAGRLPSEPCLEDGTIIVLRPLTSAERRESTNRLAVLRTTLDGRVLNVIDSLPMPPSTPLSPPTLVVARSGLVYVSDASKYEVRVITAEGRLQLVVRSTEKPPRVTDDIWSRARTISRALVAPNDQRPERLPAIRSMRVDDGGHVWLQRYDRPAELVGLDSHGGVLGIVDLPLLASTGATFVSVVSGRAAIRHYDEAGNVVLSFFRLVPVR